jgi:glycosyltransferase involved in cell wall biosynthesis
MRLSVLCSRSNRGWLDRQRLAHASTHVMRTATSQHTLIRGAALVLHARGRLPLSRSLGQGFDLVHFPLLPAVRVRDVPVAATLWDLQHHDLPGNYGAARQVYRRLAYDAVTRIVDAVFAPGAATAERIHAVLPRGRSEVRIVVPGVLDPDAAVDEAGADRMLAEVGAQPKFVYYPAAWWPHKNHATLFGAMRHLPRDVTLVLSGGGRRAAAPAAAMLAERRGVGDRVKHVGHVSAPVVRGLYRRARAVAYPSSYEGFGIPPIEAMAQGTPVVASDIPVLREVTAGAALLADHRSTRALADAISSVLEDSADRARLVRDGKARSRVFELDRGAERHLVEYKRLIGSGSADREVLEQHH